MPTYSCEQCRFTTHLKGNYTCHVASQKHVTAIELVNALRAQEQLVVNPQTIQVTEVVKVAPDFTCKHCDQKFAFKQSMYRHIKNCKKKEQEPKEMIRLMTIEMEKQKNDLLTQLKIQSEKFDDRINKIEKMLWKIEIKEEIREEIKTFMIGLNEKKENLSDF
jgi:hypothetical protein